MEHDQMSLTERGLLRALAAIRTYRVPLLTALISGLLAHGFAFTNKLLNADEIGALYAKGGGTDYGRWAIDSTKYLFPDASMPWIYGILSMLMFTAVVCLTIRFFRIRSPFLQGALAAVFLCFPGLTALYCYMFTSAPFAFSLLLAVLSVLLGCSDRWPLRVLGILLLTISLGIYQAYIAVAASYYLIRMIQMLLRDEREPREVFLFGLRALARMLPALLIYYGISRIALNALDVEYAYYGFSENSILRRVALAYNALLKTVTHGYFAYVPNMLSRLIHLLIGLFTAGWLGLWLLRHRREPARAGLLLLCLVLLPLSMNCVFLLANVEVIHSVVLYSFVCVYVLVAVVAECMEVPVAKPGRDLVLCGMLLICIVNIYFANKTYLKLYLQYENAYATYSSIITQVKMTEGFDENCKLAVLGKGSNLLYIPEELDTGDLAGPEQDLVNVYTRERLIRRFLGFDMPFASDEETSMLWTDPRYEAMPAYPYPGSVQKIDDFIVVKLG